MNEITDPHERFLRVSKWFLSGWYLKPPVSSQHSKRFSHPAIHRPPRCSRLGPVRAIAAPAAPLRHPIAFAASISREGCVVPIRVFLAQCSAIRQTGEVVLRRQIGRVAAQHSPRCPAELVDGFTNPTFCQWFSFLCKRPGLR